MSIFRSKQCYAVSLSITAQTRKQQIVQTSKQPSCISIDKSWFIQAPGYHLTLKSNASKIIWIQKETVYIINLRKPIRISYFIIPTVIFWKRLQNNTFMLQYPSIISQYHHHECQDIRCHFQEDQHWLIRVPNELS